MLNKLIQLTGSATRSVVDLSTKVASKSIPVGTKIAKEFYIGYKAKDIQATIDRVRLTQDHGPIQKELF